MTVNPAKSLQSTRFYGRRVGANAMRGGSGTFSGTVGSARTTSEEGRHFAARSTSGAAAVLPVLAVANIHRYRSPEVLGWVVHGLTGVGRSSCAVAISSGPPRPRPSWRFL